MTNTAVPKETLVAMLSEIYSQLEELENEIETSFSKLEDQLKTEEANKRFRAEQRLAMLEQKVFAKKEASEYLDCHHVPLKLELGY
ncbi:hypothetical protein ACQYAD_10075 [Neobacillus sp. SM06]|uniref:hypothetical protein n=1 Tax=Neobacillus sp. SM06 TaxID=3422492 RepID=UPI003D2D7259